MNPDVVKFCPRTSRELTNFSIISPIITLHPEKKKVVTGFVTTIRRLKAKKSNKRQMKSA
jgi:ABC-type enterochelin transport system substrate-binding protein